MAKFWTPARLSSARASLYAYRTGLVLALLVVSHALVVNVLLWSGALGSLLGSAAGGVLRIDTGRSFSVWPGVVHLRQLHLEVIDSNVHLELEVPVGRANIRLRELLRRRFSAHDVTGEHFVLRLRPRLEGLPERRQAALPPLSEPVAGPSDSTPGYLWPIQIEDTSASYDELWISELRYRGPAHVSGGFELVPQQRITVDPSDVVLGPGVLSYGPDTSVLDVQHLRLQSELRETQAEELGQRWREQLQVQLELAGRVVDVAFVSNLFPELEGVSGGAGDLSLQGAAREGQWVGQLRVEYATQALRYARGGWLGATEISLSAETPDASSAKDAQPLSANLRIGNTALSFEGKSLGKLEQCRLEGEFGRTFPLTAPRALELSLDGLALDGLEALRGNLPGPHQFVPGGVRLAAQASGRWQDERLTGKAALDFHGLRFAYGDWSFRQDGAVRLDDVSWRGPGYKVHLSRAVLELERVRLVHPELTIDPWRVRTELERVALAPLTQRLTADFLVRGDDAAPVLALLGVRSLPPGISHFLAMPDLRVRGSLEFSPERQELVIERAESDTIDVRGRLVRRDQQNHGALLFRAAPLSVGVDVQPGDTSIKLFAGDDWLRTQLAQLTKGVGPELAPVRGVDPSPASRAD